MRDPIQTVLRRQRAVTLLALAVLTLLAWAWLLVGAGMGMGPHIALDPFPHLGSDGAMAMELMGEVSLARLVLTFSMWWVMMVAMMLPAAAPVILLYAKAAPPTEGEKRATGAFLTGYLLVWGLFSLGAVLVQLGLEQSGWLAPMTMDSAAKWFSVAILIAAGAYQLSPLKESCLNHCRNPAIFLSRHYRPGRGGALRMGIEHGAFCVGCCWLLMALLFVGGVMNLAWIALLTLLVAGEKLLPFGRRMAIAAGIGFIIWGALTALA